MKFSLIILANLFLGIGISQTTQNVFLHARMDGNVSLDDGSTTQFWGYGEYTPPIPVPQDKIFLPGPLLRFNQGDTVNVTFYNDSPEDHTIHWHGLDVNQANDGVPTTSSTVDPDTNRVYTFICTEAGTFSYHCHVLTMLHLAMGMYGLFIVDPDENKNTIYTNGPRYTQDYNWLATEMNKDWNDNPLSPGPFYQYTATDFLLNGKSGSQLTTDPNYYITASTDDTIALRVSNLGYGKTTYHFPPDANTEIHMSDGRKLPSFFQSDSLEVFSGERYTLLMRPSASIHDSIRIVYSDLRTDEDLGENYIRIDVQANFVDIEENESSSIKILGNPINEILVLENSDLKSQNIKIYSSNGRLVRSTQLQQGSHIIPFNQPNGVYVVLLENGETIKFVKQ